MLPKIKHKLLKQIHIIMEYLMFLFLGADLFIITSKLLGTHFLRLFKNHMRTSIKETSHHECYTCNDFTLAPFAPLFKSCLINLWVLLASSHLPKPLVPDAIIVLISLKVTRSIDKSDMDGVKCSSRKISSLKIVFVISLDDKVVLHIWRICLLFSMIGG